MPSPKVLYSESFCEAWMMQRHFQINNWFAIWQFISIVQVEATRKIAKHLFKPEAHAALYWLENCRRHSRQAEREHKTQSVHLSCDAKDFHSKRKANSVLWESGKSQQNASSAPSCWNDLNFPF